MALNSFHIELALGFFGILIVNAILLKRRLGPAQPFPSKMFLTRIALPMAGVLVLTFFMLLVFPKRGTPAPARPRGLAHSLHDGTVLLGLAAALGTVLLWLQGRICKHAIKWRFLIEILVILGGVMLVGALLAPVLKLLVPIEAVRGGLSMVIGTIAVIYIRGLFGGAQVERAPSHWARRLLRFRHTKKVYDEVVSPTLDDMDYEWMEAVAKGDRLQAFAVRARGWWALLRAIGLWTMLRAVMSRRISK